MLRSGRVQAVLAAAAVAAVVGAGTAVPAGAAAAGPSVFGFGSNQSGELGNGTTAASYLPVPASGPPGTVRQIAAGYFTSAALISDGTVWAWGSNNSGALGTGSSGGWVATPQQVPGLSSVTQIALGIVDVYAVRSDGTLWAWGFNQSGQLGNGTTAASYQPVRVPGLTGITEVAANWASFAVRADGTLFGWGADDDGALGNGTSGGSVLTPAPVP